MVPFVNPLGRYPIPAEIEKLAGNEKQAARAMYALFRGDEDWEGEDPTGESIDFTSDLTMDNYAECMMNLLWMEETQMKVDITTYDLTDAPLLREGRRYYKLHVPGLAENRPSVLKGDKIIVKVRGGSKFEGIVHRTTQEYAMIDLPSSFSRSYIDGLRVDVRFTFSRTTLRTSHQALMVMKTKTESSLQSKIVFPQLLHMYDNPPLTPLNTRIIRAPQLNFYNRTLNSEQQTAVVDIVQSVARPAPYLIYGPPG